MKKVLIALLIILGLGGVAVISCPDRQDHKDAIMEVVSGAINDELQTSDKDVQELSAFFGSLGSGVAGFLLDKRLTVKNYFVFSVGVIKDLEGVDQKVSVGVFGHVFTGDKEQLKQAVKGK